MSKPNLTKALQRAATASPVRRPPPPPAGKASSALRPPSREGKKNIAGWFDEAASMQLSRLAIDERSSVQDLLREAINDLFEKRGLSKLA